MAKDLHIRSIPFHVFQTHCSDRNFIYTGTPGKYNLKCKMTNTEDNRCNPWNCPVWIKAKEMEERGNDNDLANEHGYVDNFEESFNEGETVDSLNDINVALKKGNKQ